MPLCERPNLWTSTEMEVTPGTEKSKRRLWRRRLFAAAVEEEGEAEEEVESSAEAASCANASTKPPRQQSTCCFLCVRVCCFCRQSRFLWVETIEEFERVREKICDFFI